MLSATACDKSISNATLKGLQAKSSDYYRYLNCDGSLTLFQRKKLDEVREKEIKKREDKLRESLERAGKSGLYALLSEEEQASVQELVGSLSVDKKGFFVDEECVEKYSLKNLFRCRCMQLGICIDRAVDAQLPSSPSHESYRLVTALNFSNSYLAARGVLALGAILNFCTELRFLNLSGVGITAVHQDELDPVSVNSLHFVVLLKALEQCKKLESLDLSWNCIQNRYSIYIMQCISSHPSLLEINLENTGLCELVRKKALRILNEKKKHSLQL